MAAVTIAEAVGSNAIYRVAVLSPFTTKARLPPLARNVGLAPTVTTPTLVSPEVLICMVLPLPEGLVERTTACPKFEGSPPGLTTGIMVGRKLCPHPTMKTPKAQKTILLMVKRKTAEMVREFKFMRLRQLRLVQK